MRVPSISELVKLSDEVIKYGLTGDIATSRKRYDRLRVLRSRIDLTIASTVGLRTSSAEQNDSYLSLDHKKIEVVHLEKNTIQIRTWLRSVIVGLSFEELFKSDEGVNLYLDVFLPESWDFSRDLAVLDVSVASNLIPALIKRGQLVYVVFEQANSRLSSELNINQLRSEYVNLKIESWDPSNSIETTGIENVMHHTWSPALTVLDPFHAIEDSDKRKLFAYCGHLSVTANTIRHWPIIFVEGWLSQLRELAVFPSMMQLRNRFKNQSVLIASSGPSLLDSLSELADCREHYLLLAPIRSLQPLLDANIVPDFAIHVDASNFSEMMPSDGQLSNTSLICIEQADKSVWGAKFREVFIAPLVNTIGSPLSNAFHGKSAIGGHGGSVSTVFADIAIQLGASSITLIGQDLSVTSDRHYASVSQSERSAEISTDKAVFAANLYCEGINGEQLPTLPDYKEFIGEFEAIRDRYGSDVLLVNATTRGARLQGWFHSALLEDPARQAMSEGSAISRDSALQAESEEVQERLILLSQAIKNERGLVATIRKLCVDITEEIKHLLKSDSHDVTELESLEERLVTFKSLPGSLFTFYSIGSAASLMGQAGSVDSLRDNLTICLQYYLQSTALAEQLDEILIAADDNISKNIC